MDDEIWANFFESFSEIDKQQGQLFEYSMEIGGHRLGMGECENEEAYPGPLARQLKQNPFRYNRKLREHQHRAL
jgi:hypothetical protein